MEKENFLQIIRKLDQKLFQRIENNTYPLGVAYGYTGVAIYLFEKAKMTNDSLYENYANLCIDYIFKELSSTMSIGIYNGYAGISLGVNVLSALGDIKISKKIFHDINELCFKNMNYVSNKEPDMISRLDTNELVLLIDYFCKQIEYSNTSQTENVIYKKLVIKIINYIYTERLEDIQCPPLYYATDNVLARYIHGLYKAHILGIHEIRIERILDDLSSFVCSLIPIQTASRLQMLYVMLEISTFYKTSIWDNHITLLYKNIDVQSIIKDLYDKAIFYDKGLASIILLLEGIKKKFPNYTIEYDERMFFEKISNSLAWNQLLVDEDYFQQHSNLFCGFPGLILVCNKMNWL